MLFPITESVAYRLFSSFTFTPLHFYLLVFEAANVNLLSKILPPSSHFNLCLGVAVELRRRMPSGGGASPTPTSWSFS